MARPVLGADQGKGPAAPLGHMGHVEPMPVDLPMQVLAQILAQREPPDTVDRIPAEGIQCRAEFAIACDPSLQHPVPGCLGRLLAAVQQRIGGVAPQQQIGRAAR